MCVYVREYDEHCIFITRTRSTCIFYDEQKGLYCESSCEESEEADGLGFFHREDAILFSFAILFFLLILIVFCFLNVESWHGKCTFG